MLARGGDMGALIRERDWAGTAVGVMEAWPQSLRTSLSVCLLSKFPMFVTVPLAPRTARAIDLAIGERSEGPLFLAGDGRRLDRYAVGRIVRTTARRAGITKPGHPAHPAARVHHRR